MTDFKPRFYLYNKEPIIYMYPEKEGITYFVQCKSAEGFSVRKYELVMSKLEIPLRKYLQKQVEDVLARAVGSEHREGIKQTIADYLRLIARELDEEIEQAVGERK